MTFKKDGKNNLAICPCRDCTGGSDGQIPNFTVLNTQRNLDGTSLKALPFVIKIIRMVYGSALNAVKVF